jgi:uncharacterized protein YaeQ
MGPMAETATVYHLSIELADIDRGVYDTFSIRLARHPSESAEYLLTRVLAYCLEYCPGILFTDGVSSGDEPAVLVRDDTGAITAWIEIGMPDAARLHRGSKAAGRAAVYTHRSVPQLLAQLAGERVHRGAEIPIYSFDRAFIDDVSSRLDRRSTLSLSITERHLYAEIDGATFSTDIAEHRIA